MDRTDTWEDIFEGTDSKALSDLFRGRGWELVCAEVQAAIELAKDEMCTTQDYAWLMQLQGRVFAWKAVLELQEKLLGAEQAESETLAEETAEDA